MLLYGDFQPKMRTQYTARVQLHNSKRLARDLVLQVGYVGSQGHRLLASHDINAANPQTCLDIATLANNNPNSVFSYGLQGTCGPFAEDNQFTVTLPSSNGSVPSNGFHLPTGATVQAAGQTLNLVGLLPTPLPIAMR